MKFSEKWVIQLIRQYKPDFFGITSTIDSVYTYVLNLFNCVFYSAKLSNIKKDNNNNNKMKKKETKNTCLIDIAVPNTHNLAKTITGKQNMYPEVGNEICATWNQKAAQMIPIVIISTGVIPKSLSQSLTRLNLHPNTYIQLQKSVILGKRSIARNFLN